MCYLTAEQGAVVRLQDISLSLSHHLSEIIVLERAVEGLNLILRL